MAEYLIQGDTLSAAADKIREFITPVGNNTHQIDSAFIANSTIKTLDTENIPIYYFENSGNSYTAADLGYLDYAGGPVAYDYLQNNEGNIVPVLYLGENDGIFDEPYFYVGIDKIDRGVYDKWRKIERAFEAGSQEEPDPELNYTWESTIKKYIYTERIVYNVNSYAQKFVPTEFPTKIHDVYIAGMANSSDGNIVYDSESKTLFITSN